MSLSRATFKKPRVAWDCALDEEVLLVSYPVLHPGDNPMQAELASCAGLNANHFCRTCKVGGSKAYKESDEGFASLLKVRLSACVFNRIH